MEIIKAEFGKSAVLEKEYPEFNGLEFSFIGRSNVRKSPLINSLTNRRGLARTSKTPGRTQLINYFLIDNLGFKYLLISPKLINSTDSTVNNNVDKNATHHEKFV